MALVINTKTYKGDVAVTPNQVPYLGPLQTLAVKDRLDLYRTLPKATTTFSGVGRSRAKLVRTATLTGAKTSTGDAIASVDISFPVGMSVADQDAFMTDFGAFISSADAKNLAKNLTVSF